MANIMKINFGSANFINNFHSSTINNVRTSNGVVSKIDTFYPIGIVINIRTSEPTYNDSATITLKFYDKDNSIIDTITSKQTLGPGGYRQIVEPVRDGEVPIEISKFTVQLTGAQFPTHYRIEYATVVGYIK